MNKSNISACSSQHHKFIRHYQLLYVFMEYVWYYLLGTAESYHIYDLIGEVIACHSGRGALLTASVCIGWTVKRIAARKLHVLLTNN